MDKPLQQKQAGCYAHLVSSSRWMKLQGCTEAKILLQKYLNQGQKLVQEFCSTQKSRKIFSTYGRKTTGECISVKIYECILAFVMAMKLDEYGCTNI